MRDDLHEFSVLCLELGILLLRPFAAVFLHVFRIGQLVEGLSFHAERIVRQQNGTDDQARENQTSKGREYLLDLVANERCTLTHSALRKHAFDGNGDPSGKVAQGAEFQALARRIEEPREKQTCDKNDRVNEKHGFQRGNADIKKIDASPIHQRLLAVDAPEEVQILERIVCVEIVLGRREIVQRGEQNPDGKGGNVAREHGGKRNDRHHENEAGEKSEQKGQHETAADRRHERAKAEGFHHLQGRIDAVIAVANADRRQRGERQHEADEQTVNEGNDHFCDIGCGSAPLGNAENTDHATAFFGNEDQHTANDHRDHRDHAEARIVKKDVVASDIGDREFHILQQIVGFQNALLICDLKAVFRISQITVFVDVSVCDTDGHLNRPLICSRIIFQLGEGLGKQGVVLVAVGAVGIRQPCLPCMDTLEIVLGNSVVFIDEILHLLLHALRIGKIVRKEGVELFFRKHRLLVYLT